MYNRQICVLESKIKQQGDHHRKLPVFFHLPWRLHRSASFESFFGFPPKIAHE